MDALAGLLDSAAVGALTAALGAPLARRIASSILTVAGARSGDDDDGDATTALLRVLAESAAHTPRPHLAAANGGDGGARGTTNALQSSTSESEALPAAKGRRAGQGTARARAEVQKQATLSLVAACLGSVVAAVAIWRRYRSWGRARQLAFWMALAMGFRARLARTPILTWLLGVLDNTPLGLSGLSGHTAAGLQRHRRLLTRMHAVGGRTVPEHLGITAFEQPSAHFGAGDSDCATEAVACRRHDRMIEASDGTPLRLRVFSPVLRKGAPAPSARVAAAAARAQAARVASQAAAGARAAASDLAAAGLSALKRLTAAGHATAGAATASGAGARAGASSSAGSGNAARGAGAVPSTSAGAGVSGTAPTAPASAVATGPRGAGAGVGTRLDATPTLDALLDDAPAGDLPVVVYFHGGGWVIGGDDGGRMGSDDLCEQIARRSQCVVVSVDYRLGPETKFPAPFQDACDAVVWVQRHARKIGARADRLVLAGDSAGGNLAAAVAQRARDEAWSPPVLAQALVYPAVCHAFDSATMQAYGRGHVLSEKTMRFFSNSYLSKPGDASHPYAAPLACPDLSRLPPTLVSLAEFDILRDDGRAFAAALAATGVSVSVIHHAGMPHGFAFMRAMFPAEQDRLVTELSQFVKFWSEVATEVEAADMLAAATSLTPLGAASGIGYGGVGAGVGIGGGGVLTGSAAAGWESAAFSAVTPLPSTAAAPGRSPAVLTVDDGDAGGDDTDANPFSA